MRLRKLHTFENYQEAMNSEQSVKNDFGLGVDSVEVLREDDENLEVRIIMEGGDQIYFESFISARPYGGKESRGRLVINGQEVGMTQPEKDYGLDGAKAAYLRWKSEQMNKNFK